MEIQYTSAGTKPKPLVVKDFDTGTRTNLAIAFFEDGLGASVNIPFIVVRGKHPGPTLGISAAVHGDELNGIRIIHGVVEALDLSQLRGALLCAPIVNVPAYRAGERRFNDGSDLNHAFPGKRNGRTSQQYAWRFSRTFLPPLDALIDVHTASEGRVNSFYVRADLENPAVRPLALAMNSEIVLHVKGSDSTLRGAARKRGIPGLTVEAGNPSTIQDSMVDHGIRGVLRVMESLDMLDIAEAPKRRKTIICKSSQWLHTATGGVLDCGFDLRDTLEKGQVVAETRNPFGKVTQTYKAPHSGVVIGMARNPVAVPGTRYCHLGEIGDPQEDV